MTSMKSTSIAKYGSLFTLPALIADCDTRSVRAHSLVHGLSSPVSQAFGGNSFAWCPIDTPHGRFPSTTHYNLIICFG